MATAKCGGTGEPDPIRSRPSIERAPLLASVRQACPKDDRPAGRSSGWHGRERGARRSFRWSFRQAPHHITGLYRLDDAPDLTYEDGTLRDGVDGCGSTSNP
jgi:hypothetical protein